MDSFCKLPMLLVVFFTVITISPTTPQPCNSYKSPNNIIFSACNDLALLDSSIHWNYRSSSSSINLAFKNNNAKHNGWTAWTINPTKRAMVGSQAFVAFKKSDGTMTAHTSPITRYTAKLQEVRLSFEVRGVSASYEDGVKIMYASLKLLGDSMDRLCRWQSFTF